MADDEVTFSTEPRTRLVGLIIGSRDEFEVVVMDEEKILILGYVEEISLVVRSKDEIDQALQSQRCFSNLPVYSVDILTSTCRHHCAGVILLVLLPWCRCSVIVAVASGPCSLDLYVRASSSQPLLSQRRGPGLASPVLPS